MTLILKNTALTHSKSSGHGHDSWCLCGWQEVGVTVFGSIIADKHLSEQTESLRALHSTSETNCHQMPVLQSINTSSKEPSSVSTGCGDSNGVAQGVPNQIQVVESPSEDTSSHDHR